MKIVTIGLSVTLFLIVIAVWQSQPAQTQATGPFTITSSGRGDTAFLLNTATGQVHFCQVKSSMYGRDVEGSCAALATE